jgi:hypothetical protein
MVAPDHSRLQYRRFTYIEIIPDLLQLRSAIPVTEIYWVGLCLHILQIKKHGMWCHVSILQIILYYLKALHNDTLPSEIITVSITLNIAHFSLKGTSPVDDCHKISSEFVQTED